MELVMQLPVPDREARKALNDNFVAIKQEDEKDDARLNREIQERADLQRQIDSLNTRLTTAENNIINLQTRTLSLEQQVKKLNDIIFGMEYINDTDEILLDSSTFNPSEVEINDDVAVDDDKAEVTADLPHDVIDNEVS